jgi:hypothetical protein
MTYEYVEPTDEQKELLKEFRDEFERITMSIKFSVSESRERSIALTKLEEASFWLNKGITHND